jgi:hypothetical protein
MRMYAVSGLNVATSRLACLFKCLASSPCRDVRDCCMPASACASVVYIGGRNMSPRRGRGRGSIAAYTVAKFCLEISRRQRHKDRRNPFDASAFAPLHSCDLQWSFKTIRRCKYFCAVASCNGSRLRRCHTRVHLSRTRVQSFQTSLQSAEWTTHSYAVCLT